jgi:hypothetical protein
MVIMTTVVYVAVLSVEIAKEMAFQVEFMSLHPSARRCLEVGKV